jgi:S1-C subfamily serine protease
VPGFGFAIPANIVTGGISDTEALAAVLASLRPGQRVQVTAITSGGSKVTLQVTLGQLPGS